MHCFYASLPLALLGTGLKNSNVEDKDLLKTRISAVKLSSEGCFSDRSMALLAALRFAVVLPLLPHDDPLPNDVLAV